MTTPILEQLTQEYAELKQLQQLPDLVVRLLGLIKNPIYTATAGRAGRQERCFFCRASRGRKDSRPVEHYATCAWVAAMKQAYELRASGVLPPEAAKQAAA